MQFEQPLTKDGSSGTGSHPLETYHYNVFGFDFKLPAPLLEGFSGWPEWVLPTVNVRLTTPESISLPMGEGSGCLNTPGFLWCVLSGGPITHSGGLFESAPVKGSPPWLAPLLHSPGVTSQISSLHLNAYLRLCFWGNPNQDNSSWEWPFISAEVKENKDKGFCTFLHWNVIIIM